MESILVLYNLKWSHIFVRIHFWIEETKLALMLAFNQSKSWSHNLSMIGLNTGENWINFLLLSELHKMTMDGHLAHSAMTRQWNWTPIAIIESEYLSFGGEFTSKECFWSKKEWGCVSVCVSVCVSECVCVCAYVWAGGRGRSTQQIVKWSMGPNESAERERMNKR